MKLNRYHTPGMVPYNMKDYFDSCALNNTIKFVLEDIALHVTEECERGNKNKNKNGAESSKDERTMFLFYNYDDKYILIELNLDGMQCNGYKRGSATFNAVIERALEQCYVSSNMEDLERYYLWRTKGTDTVEQD